MGVPVARALPVTCVAVFLRAEAPYRSVGQVAAELDMSKQVSTGLGVFCTLSVMLLVVVYQVARSLDALVFALSLLVLVLGGGSLGAGLAAFLDWLRYRW